MSAEAVSEAISAATAGPAEAVSAPKSTTSGPQSTGTKFEKALMLWSEIGFEDLQKTLDTQCLEIVDNQKTSVESRKQLASKTKEFKKLNDEEKLKEMKQLLKMYQSEIDNLTKRCKFAESSFMNVYRPLAEAPDPTPLLEACVDSVLSVSELSKLSKENSKLQEQLVKYADYDHIKSRLSKLEQQAADNVVAKVKAKELELKALFDEKERNWKNKEAVYEKQLQQARDELKEIKANFEVSEARLNAQSRNIGDDDSLATHTSLVEMEIISRDLETANTRVLELEKRNEELRAELQEAKTGSKLDDLRSELESKIADYHSENTILSARVQSQKDMIESLRSELKAQKESLEKQLEQKTTEVSHLKASLLKYQDYEDLKQELNILRQLEFGLDEDEDETGSEETDGKPRTKIAEDSVEQLLISRNKKLDNELTLYRVQNEKLSKQVDELQTQVGAAVENIEKLEKLNEQLERDLTTSLGEARMNMNTGASSVIGGPTMSRTGAKLSPAASIAGGFDTMSVAGGSQSSVANSDGSLLTIVTQQRDRFRVRNSELEEDIRKHTLLISDLRNEIKKLQKDNSELYERSRYVSSFTGNQNTNRRAAGHDVEAYRDNYENNLSPFQKFRGQERDRALSKMSPLERITYSFSSMILANKHTRNLFVFYCIGLHLLVMVMMLYTLGIHGSMTPEVSSVAGKAGSVVEGHGENIDSGWRVGDQND